MIAFVSSMQSEWFSIEQVAGMLNYTSEQVLKLIQDGTLTARNIANELKIDSASLDKYTDFYNRPLMGKPKPRVFVKTAHGVVEEIS